MSLGSLRLRLLLGAGAFIFTAIALAAIGLTLLFQRHVERWIDGELGAHLDHLIAGIDRQPGGELAVVRPPGDPRFERPLSGLYWQVLVEPSGPVLRSRSLWDTEIALPPEASIDDAVHHHRVAGPGGQTLYLLQRRVELPSRLGERTARVAVALDDAQVRSAVWRFAGALLPFLLVLGALLTAAAWVQVAFGLRPLAAVRQRLAAIGSGRTQRLGGGFPDEVQPLAAEIDALLDLRDRQVAKARARAADLAHGLKTPLQVLATDAERLRAAGDAAIADEIEEIAAVMQRHVDRQLARARVAAGETEAAANVSAVARQVVRVVERSPDGQRVRWSLDVPPELAARIDPEDLTEALGNLVENAARHARSEVTLSAHAQSGFVIVTVADDGPGIPAERREDVMRWGRRLDQSGPGAGLGLAIVAEIAEVWGATFSIDAPEQGCRVALRVPVARASAARSE